MRRTRSSLPSGRNWSPWRCCPERGTRRDGTSTPPDTSGVSWAGWPRTGPRTRLPPPTAEACGSRRPQLAPPVPAVDLDEGADPRALPVGVRLAGVVARQPVDVAQIRVARDGGDPPLQAHVGV